METIFEALDRLWPDAKAELAGRFTTQRFREIVESKDPELWRRMVEKWGPGGKGSGNYYSPANVLYNFLDRKVLDGILIRHRSLPASPGWGADRVKSFELVAANTPPPVSEEDESFVEGDLKLRTHLVRERKRGLREALLKSRGTAGLFCDICRMSGSSLNEDIRTSIFEAHHSSEPLSSGGQKKTKLKDMALLCANCHRALHRLVTVRGQWFGIEEARKELT